MNFCNKDALDGGAIIHNLCVAEVLVQNAATEQSLIWFSLCVLRLFSGIIRGGYGCGSGPNRSSKLTGRSDGTRGGSGRGS